MNHTELVMRRRNVREFIMSDPVEIIISRKGPSTQTAAGGVIPGASMPLPPQTARIVLNKRRFNNGIVNSEAGDIPHTDYLLVGMHTLDIQDEDTFLWMGNHYKVTGKYDNRRESTLCSIDILGERNRNG